MAFTTPDVYVREVKVFPPSVAEVETAVPAFIGYTQYATKDADGDLHLKPTVIYSMTDFQQYFGQAQPQQLEVDLTANDGGTFDAVIAGSPNPDYLLYHCMKLYFDNGGGKCYIVSVGGYKTAAPLFDPDELTAGLGAVQLEDEPTLLVIPEAVRLPYDKYGALAQAMLVQCFNLGDRFAILDAFAGDLGPDDTVPDAGKDVPTANREAWLGDLDHLKYGAAYYPFIKTSINPPVDDETKITVKVTTGAGTATHLLSDLRNNDPNATPVDSRTQLYNAARAALAKAFLVLPPSGAVTGVYAYTDTNRGVWKAPANVPLNDVLEPAVKIDNEKQGPLNVDPTSGKSINALRAFAGKGTLVWGARTLAGNDNEWRYVNVRRFFNMVEESVKKSTYWAVFESNDANTWVKVRGMIEAYLTQKWREGALAGATPKDAFFVHCGLGTTMNAQDILEGRMNVEIGMAVVRPAEFIILKFSHMMQTS